MVHNVLRCTFSINGITCWSLNVSNIHCTLVFTKIYLKLLLLVENRKERGRECHVCVCNLCAHAHLCFHTHMCISLVDVYIYVYVPRIACMPSRPNPSMWTSLRENNCMHRRSSHFNAPKIIIKGENPLNEGWCTKHNVNDVALKSTQRIS